MISFDWVCDFRISHVSFLHFLHAITLEWLITNVYAQIKRFLLLSNGSYKSYWQRSSYSHFHVQSSDSSCRIHPNNVHNGKETRLLTFMYCCRYCFRENNFDQRLMTKTDTQTVSCIHNVRIDVALMLFQKKGNVFACIVTNLISNWIDKRNIVIFLVIYYI